MEWYHEHGGDGGGDGARNHDGLASPPFDQHAGGNIPQQGPKARPGDHKGNQAEVDLKLLLGEERQRRHKDALSRTEEQ